MFGLLATAISGCQGIPVVDAGGAGWSRFVLAVL